MKTMCLIPARAGSKGIPGKNMAEVGGKPLIQYTFEAADGVFCDPDVYVSTDCSIIAKAANQHGFRVIARPSALAQDDSPIIPVIQHALEHADTDYDAVCLLQPTSPVRPDGLIDNCLRRLDNSLWTCLVTVAPIPTQFNPRSAMLVGEYGNGDWLFPDFEYCCRQKLPRLYFRTGQIYIFRTNLITDVHKEPTIYGKRMSAVIRTDPDELINIDAPEDLEKFRQYLAKEN